MRSRRVCARSPLLSAPNKDALEVKSGKKCMTYSNVTSHLAAAPTSEARTATQRKGRPDVTATHNIRRFPSISILRLQNSRQPRTTARTRRRGDWGLASGSSGDLHMCSACVALWPTMGS